jgi:hypothetical protein
MGIKSIFNCQRFKSWFYRPKSVHFSHECHLPGVDRTPSILSIHSMAWTPWIWMACLYICIIKFVWSSNLWTSQFHSNGPCYYFFMENFNIISEVIVFPTFELCNSCFRMKFYFFNVAILYIERGERKSLKKFKERLNARMTIFDYQKGQVLCQ